jgi:hypothetical protein
MNLLSHNEFLDCGDHFRLVMTLGEWACRVKNISQKGLYLRRPWNLLVENLKFGVLQHDTAYLNEEMADKD